MPRFLLAAFIALSLALSGPLNPAAQAATTTCTTNPPAGTVVKGNLVVPAGQSCTMDGSTVGGNITVGHSARLGLKNSTVNGNVTVNGSGNVLGTVVVFRSTVKGSLTISGAFQVLIDFITVDGETRLTNVFNLHASDNHFRDNLTVAAAGNDGALLERNDVRGNLTADGNILVRLTDNQIGGKLSCSGNGRPSGSNNTAQDGKFGQCAGL